MLIYIGSFLVLFWCSVLGKHNALCEHWPFAFLYFIREYTMSVALTSSKKNPWKTAVPWACAHPYHNLDLTPKLLSLYWSHWTSRSHSSHLFQQKLLQCYFSDELDLPEDLQHVECHLHCFHSLHMLMVLILVLLVLLSHSTHQ